MFPIDTPMNGINLASREYLNLGFCTVFCKQNAPKHDDNVADTYADNICVLFMSTLVFLLD